MRGNEVQNNKSEKKKMRNAFNGQWAIVALNYEEITQNLENASNIKSLKNKYNRKELDYPSKIDDWNR